MKVGEEEPPIEKVTNLALAIKESKNNRYYHATHLGVTRITSMFNNRAARVGTTNLVVYLIQKYKIIEITQE